VNQEICRPKIVRRLDIDTLDRQFLLVIFFSPPVNSPTDMLCLWTMMSCNTVILDP
jgi:hypothetical protein